MSCIVPMMHYRSQHIWELLHPLARQSQHGLPTVLGVVGSVARHVIVDMSLAILSLCFPVLYV